MPTSPELTGGAGFTFEDAVSGYYLAALLAQQGARGLERAIVAQVSVQRAALGQPMDDIIIDGEDAAGAVRLSVQVKRSFRIAATPDNTDFFDIVARAQATLDQAGFREGRDRVAVAAEEISGESLRQARAVCDWARDSATASDFLGRIALQRFAATAKRNVVAAVKDALSHALGQAPSDAQLHRFFRHFLVLRFDLLGEGAQDGDLVLDRLRSALQPESVGQAAIDCGWWRGKPQGAQEASICRLCANG